MMDRFIDDKHEPLALGLLLAERAKVRGIAAMDECAHLYLTIHGTFSAFIAPDGSSTPGTPGQQRGTTDARKAPARFDDLSAIVGRIGSGTMTLP